MATVLYKGLQHKHGDDEGFPVYARVAGVEGFRKAQQVNNLLKPPQGWIVWTQPAANLWSSEQGSVTEVFCVPPCMKRSALWAKEEGHLVPLFAELEQAACWEQEEATHSPTRLNLAEQAWPKVVQIESARVTFKIRPVLAKVLGERVLASHPNASLDGKLLSLPMDEVQLFLHPKLGAAFFRVGRDLLIHGYPELLFGDEAGLGDTSSGVHVHGLGIYANAIGTFLAQQRLREGKSLNMVGDLFAALAERARTRQAQSSEASGGHSGQHG